MMCYYLNVQLQFMSASNIRPIL